jgi:succinyl-diaminopimelate desuccinylase
MPGVPEDEFVDLLTEIVARETVNPPGNEGALADYFDWFEASSVEFDVELQEVHSGRPNVIARAGDPARGSLLLTGHMDVVPASSDDWSEDPFELQRENDRLIGRGTADMKGALAAKLVAAEAFLTEYDDTGEVILAFTVDEEVGGSGTRALVESGIEADAAIIGEPTQLHVAIAEYGAVGLLADGLWRKWSLRSP